jgi:hypothetical protein
MEIRALNISNNEDDSEQFIVNRMLLVDMDLVIALSNLGSVYCSVHEDKLSFMQGTYTEFGTNYNKELLDHLYKL